MKAARGIVCLLFACLLAGSGVSAQAKPAESQPVTITSVLDNQLTLIERQIVPAADAMPEDKYSFSPTDGNFKGVRTFSEEVRHIATANTSFFGSILNLPIGPETENGPGSNGPDSIQTKAQIMQYLRDSFALGHKAIATINSDNELAPVKSPALPFVKTMAATAIFACQHMMDHYGQMVEYLRDNGIVPPASAKRAPAGSGREMKQRFHTLVPAAALAIAAAALCPASANADYAVLRSGMRLHVTGYELTGDHVRLAVPGGTVEIAAGDLIDVEPEDLFPAPPPANVDFGLRYAALIHASSQKHGVDEKLITQVIAAESNFDAKAVSRKRALGLMQLLRETAARYSVINVFDPAQNIDAGTHYLKDLLERYKGNVQLALAAYNAGPEMVDRYGGIPPFPETQNYVREITANLNTARR